MNVKFLLAVLLVAAVLLAGIFRWKRPAEGEAEAERQVIGAIPAAVLAGVLGRAREAGVLCVLNLAPAPDGAAGLLAGGVDWLVVNEQEAAAVLGRPVTGAAGPADWMPAGRYGPDT